MSKKKKTTKQRHYDKLLNYLSDPANDMLTRRELSTKVLGYKQPHGIYNSFTPDDLYEIERLALENRRKRYSVWLSKVDRGLINKACKGDAQAAKLIYQRFENWSEKIDHNLSADVKADMKWEIEIIDTKNDDD